MMELILAATDQEKDENLVIVLALIFLIGAVFGIARIFKGGDDD